MFSSNLKIEPLLDLICPEREYSQIKARILECLPVRQKLEIMLNFNVMEHCNKRIYEYTKGECE